MLTGRHFLQEMIAVFYRNDIIAEQLDWHDFETIGVTMINSGTVSIAAVIAIFLSNISKSLSTTHRI
jgi:hypothetical protein